MSSRSLKSRTTSSRLEGPYSAGQAELGKRLLELGGAVVCYRPYEPLLALILERGGPFPGEGSEVRVMNRSQCHTNSATLWYESRGEVTIVSGYALSADGIWRQHSWGLDGGRVIETTCERKLYYGVELDLPHSLVFTLANPPASLREYSHSERTPRLLGEVVAWSRAH